MLINALCSSPHPIVQVQNSAIVWSKATILPSEAPIYVFPVAADKLIPPVMNNDNKFTFIALASGDLIN